MQQIFVMREFIKANRDRFISYLSKADNIVLVGHLNPDGDCIGSLTAMKHYITHRFKDKRVTMVVPSPYPSFLNFLDPHKEVVVHREKPSLCKDLIMGCDLLICMDFGKASRAEGMEEYIKTTCAPKILIDHHLEYDNFAQLKFSFSKISSASELTYWLLMECEDNRQLPMEVLTSLATGVITDTNNFSNSLFPSTFLMASQIVDSGLNLSMIQERVLNSYSKERMRLMGEMLLNKMELFHNSHVSLMILDIETQKKFNYQSGDSEGFVNLPLKIADVKISALFTQQEDFLRVSLRSQGDISVNDLSKQFFNGGGHKNAAGGRIFVNIEQVAQYYKDSVETFIKENNILFEDD